MVNPSIVDLLWWHWKEHVHEVHPWHHKDRLRYVCSPEWTFHFAIQLWWLETKTWTKYIECKFKVKESTFFLMIRKRSLWINMVICHSDFHPIALKGSTKRNKLLAFCETCSFFCSKATAQYLVDKPPYVHFPNGLAAKVLRHDLILIGLGAEFIPQKKGSVLLHMYWTPK